MLYDNGLSGIAISFIASSALAYSFKDSSLTEFKFIWWLCMSAVLLLRITDTAIWRWSSLSQNGKLSVYRFITGTFLTAGMWCVYGIVVLLQADIIELVSTVIIQYGYYSFCHGWWRGYCSFSSPYYECFIRDYFIGSIVNNIIARR